jgi:dihydroorotate dehydrogenase
MSPVARYITINISSPNTPGLRQLQDEGALNALLSAIGEARDASGPPIFLKVAPDLGEGEPDQIVRVALQHRIQAIIVANTTVSRPPLKSRHATEQGGLSGEPLKSLALKALRDFRSASGGEIPLIGVGGIGSADDAWDRIRAGASLVQLYSAMVYEGPGIAMRIARGLEQRLKQEGFSNIAEAVGTAR